MQIKQQKIIPMSLAIAVVSFCLLSACSTDEIISTAGSPLNQGADEDSGSPELTLRSVSTRSWLVTGGDVLLEIVLNQEVDPSSLQIFLNGNVEDLQLVQTDSTRYQFLLADLPMGDSVLKVTIGETQASLSLSNFPISGPIISGPHEMPFLCQTAEFELVTGEIYGPALDDNCFRETRVDYVYYSEQDQHFKPYELDSVGLPPTDLARIVREDGQAWPYIVRVETGVVNRSIYEIAMLHSPINPEPNPWVQSEQWNKKLVYTHGGGCRRGWYQQGQATGGVLHDGLLRQGYALVSSTLNVFGQNCNDLLASETHIMTKERFIEHYGEPVYTIATGESGGSYQSHQTADNYPGVFDGIIIGLSFPDVTSATIFTLADSRLLHYYFNIINPDGFTEEEQRAVAGFAVHASIANLAQGSARLDPIYEEGVALEQQGGEVNIPALEPLRYDSANQSGIRATVYDHTINVYGHVPGTRIARRPLDNVGLQYGLTAFNAGIISTEQFINLNRDIGGFDRDLNHVPQRHRADFEATKRAIESGRILYGGAGLASTPIIDYRNYLDRQTAGDIHMLVHQFSTRQRLVSFNGHAENQIMQIGGRWGFNGDAQDLGHLFRKMDEWIMSIHEDTTMLTRAEKVRNNRPSTLNDACWDNRQAQRIRIEEPQTFVGNSECNELYPAFPTPRQIAGAPLANNIVICQLRPLMRESYTTFLTDEEWRELQAIFPEGVCDWSQGDAVMAKHQGTWKSFGPSPVNRLYSP